MVYRVYVEKKPQLAHEADALLAEAKTLLGVPAVEKLRILNRYDAQDISDELFENAVKTVFSEPQLDNVLYEEDFQQILRESQASSDIYCFAVEYLPGQFDQRADSAAQCIQIISRSHRPLIRTAKVYILYGSLTPDDISRIKKYVINPVEAREADFALPDTLDIKYDIPDHVNTLSGFTKLDASGLRDFIKDYGLAMDEGDIAFCQDYFLKENRDPTITEIRLIDTYWSDHCRHTTFQTIIDNAVFHDDQLQKAYEAYMDTRKSLNRTKPVCLMDLATIAVKALRSQGRLDKLDESEEINACTVKMDVTVDGKKEPWLLLFKNETHNHPTEIEPFGGAATCIGGAIRDPLSGRSYVYGAMRVTGAADPLKPISETIAGKLPQRKIVTTAAAGYSSYGNQIGLATGIVDEIYHPGYAAKRMEIGAVIAAAPAENVRRKTPLPGDLIILLGGATGRDGCGGATGSSKSHTVQSLETCGAEVQKGNAPEERKLQRLFRNKEASLMIKRCNDFGAGGVSVAIGELAPGLLIDLNTVPKKYEGLDGTELAISESQERMAVVISPEDLNRFMALADSENLQATVVAKVQSDPRLVMTWNDTQIVNLSREFLDSNGAPRHISIECPKAQTAFRTVSGSFIQNLKDTASNLNTCSKRGLAERFDSTIGAGTVLMPFGGRYQLTPAQAMVQKISVEKKHTDDCSVMAFGYNPYISEKSPYHGAYLAVLESVCKLIACGSEFKDVYLTFQEYFEKPGHDPLRWGQPLAALLGAFSAQMGLGIGAIGGKDSMSGTFEDLDVPPALVSFAVTTENAKNIISPEFKNAGNNLILITPDHDEYYLPETASLLHVFDRVTSLIRSGQAAACYTPGMGGVGEAVMKMAFGNMLGAQLNESLSIQEIFGYSYASFLLEVTDKYEKPSDGCGFSEKVIGCVAQQPCVSRMDESISLDELLDIYEGKLETVFPCYVQKNESSPEEDIQVSAFSSDEDQPCCRAPYIKQARPKVLIPAFPGTNCEMDSAKAVEDAGASAKVIVINNLTSDGINRSIEQFSKELETSQMIFIPGGFSGGDEPDGSGKFITAFFRNAQIKDGVTKLLEERDGLICGICNGFQALIKLGLVPYGRITDTDENSPTLTFNTIGRHQSRIVRTRIVSCKSPWLRLVKPGDIVNVPVSHGEGRFLARREDIMKLAANGQIAAQYVDPDGKPTMDIRYNPNGSMYAIEGITSPDGRVFGKMGHSERVGSYLYKNVPGNYDIRMFESAVEYFSKI